MSACRRALGLASMEASSCVAPWCDVGRKSRSMRAERTRIDSSENRRGPATPGEESHRIWPDAVCVVLRPYQEQCSSGVLRPHT